jgi:PBP1b-binding outer membrane lipoprotein LpoB
MNYMKIVLSIALALFLIGCSDDKATTTGDESQNAAMEKTVEAVEANVTDLTSAVTAEVEAVVEDATDTTVEVANEATEAVAEATEAVTEVVEEAAEEVVGVTRETEN